MLTSTLSTSDILDLLADEAERWREVGVIEAERDCASALIDDGIDIIERARTRIAAGDLTRMVDGAARAIALIVDGVRDGFEDDLNRDRHVIAAALALTYPARVRGDRLN